MPPSSTQLKPSQDASLSGNRTTFTPQLLIVSQSGVAVPVCDPHGFDGDQPKIGTPSKPLRFTPRSCTSAPCASTKRLPETDIAKPELLLTVTVVEAGVPSAAPLGLANATLKLTGLLITVELIGTTMLFVLASPAAQLNVPDWAV